jgi:hypothetical protein
MTFDLDAALGLPFTFTFDGQEYTLPPDVDFDTITALQSEHLQDAFAGLLGPEQWQRLDASPKVFGARAFTAVMKEYLTHLGLGMGESSASPPSVQNTPVPSRRTFSDTTDTASPTSDSLPVTVTG